MGIKSIICRKLRSKPQEDGWVHQVAENLLQLDFTAELPNRKG